MRRVTLAGSVVLSVQEFADGEPALLLHAWGETHRSFDRLVPLLPRTLRLVVPDQLAAALTIPTFVWIATIDGLLAAAPPLEAGQITAPTLILWGEEDGVLPAGQASELAAAIEGSRLVRYEGTGHPVLWEQPERVAADLRAFIANPPAG